MRWRILISVCCLYFACGCGTAGRGENQATRTAQIIRSQQMATQIASNLQSTVQVEDRQVTATSQAIQALIDSSVTWKTVLPADFGEAAAAWETGEESNEYGKSQWTIGDGKYHWEASALQGMVWWSIPDMQPVTDFYLSVLAEQKEGPPDALLGLTFRVTPDENGYYVFQIDSSGEYAVYRLEGDQWIGVLPWSTTNAYQTHAPNRLAVLGRGSHFIFLVNGQPVDEVSDETLPNGTVGLMIGLNNSADQGVWEFSDFQIRVPPDMPANLTSTP
jgi:hypothetical protein